MEKTTISMAIFNSKLLNYQRVLWQKLTPLVAIHSFQVASFCNIEEELPTEDRARLRQCLVQKMEDPKEIPWKKPLKIHDIS